MADSYILEAQNRTVIGKKVGAMRRDGIIPVVVYGKTTAPMHLQINERALQTVLLKAGGTHVINLALDGGSSQAVITREVQRHVVTRKIMHVDFLAIDATTKIRAEVPVHFINESPIVQMSQGVLLNGVSIVEIEALPSDLIDRLDVDLTLLTEVTSVLYVKDIDLGGKVIITSDPEAMLVRISQQVVEEEAPIEGVTASEPEVIEKGKKDEEDE